MGAEPLGPDAALVEHLAPVVQPRRCELAREERVPAELAGPQPLAGRTVAAM